MKFGIIWRDDDDEDMRVELADDIDDIVYALSAIGKMVEDTEKAKAAAYTAGE